MIQQARFALGELFFLIASCALQAQELPLASPRCEYSQVVGLTKISIRYSRPGVKGRKIWGHLVPYDVVWRTGANEATVITFSDDVWLNDLRIAAGSYALYTIPHRRGEWDVILNKNTRSWGTTGFRPEDNVLAFKARRRRAPFTETFSIDIENITRTGADLVMRWEKLAISIPIRVEVDEKVNRNINQAIATAGNNWRVYANVAEYCLRNHIRLNEAKQWIEKALELKPDNFLPHWLRADYAALQGNFQEAIASAEEALRLGIAESGNNFFYKKDLEKSIALWRSKIK
ncbi:MAG: DUF2911 domain-containing protein [Cytophagales bacterium]|nr:DUF2911 domain-containing protein [Bernardetiaceae bacterium]MDW8210209.1 DUF2911 domain-containing protein [Cytophagales bacterium]